MRSCELTDWKTQKLENRDSLIQILKDVLASTLRKLSNLMLVSTNHKCTNVVGDLFCEETLNLNGTSQSQATMVQ